MTGGGESFDAALVAIDGWGADHASAAVIGPTGVLAARGDQTHRYRWASVTKPVTALAVLIAAERGLLELDEPAGPPGATVRQLLAHASGLTFDGDAIRASPGSRRIYSSRAFDTLGALVAERAGVTFDRALTDWVLHPLGMADTNLVGRPSEGLHGPLRDLAAFAGELLYPTLLPFDTMASATSVAFPGLSGVVPGIGWFDPCDWGLGVELHGGKAPHWMGERNSPGAFGHFGGSGTFLWVDPLADLALAVLTDRQFGPWALDAWPALSDKLLSVGARNGR